MPLSLPPLMANLGETVPANAVIGGKAYVNKLNLSTYNQEMIGPNGPTILTCDPFVTKINLTADDDTLGLVFGRQSYDREATDIPVCAGLDIATSALFFSPANTSRMLPYTYNYTIVDGGGTFEVVYYSAFSGFLSTFPDPNGNFIPRLPNGATQGNPITMGTPDMPTKSQKTRYPQLGNNPSSLLSDKVHNQLFDPVPGDNNTLFVKGFNGVAIGIVYIPGGNDPALANMNWLQLVNFTSLADAGGLAYYSDGAEGGSVSFAQDQFGVQTSFFGQPVPLLSPLSKAPYLWAIDNRSQIADFRYGQRADAGFQFPIGTAPIDPGTVNTLSLIDAPSDDSGTVNKVGRLGAKLNLSKPGDIMGENNFYLFKCAYYDDNGNISPIPVADASGFINVFIFRQGVKYGYVLTNRPK